MEAALKLCELAAVVGSGSVALDECIETELRGCRGYGNAEGQHRDAGNTATPCAEKGGDGGCQQRTEDDAFFADAIADHGRVFGAEEDP